jgi:predicted glycogen debranching enzyme
MEKILRKIDLAGAGAKDLDLFLHREWLLTNGLGGYASGTISGHITRRYHGYLTAALPSPFGRTVMLNHLSECVVLADGRRIQFGGEERSNEDDPLLTAHYLTEFRLENQLPFWRYEVEGIVIEKRVNLLYLQNTVHISYRLLSDQESVELELRPSLHFRQHEHAVSEPLKAEYRLVIFHDRYEILDGSDLPPLRLYLHGDCGAFTHDRGTRREHFYQIESERGYDSRGMLWSPGYFSVTLLPTKGATLIASTEQWPTVLALTPEEAVNSENERREKLIALVDPKAREGPAAELVLAADQFLITPAGRTEDAARAHAAGDEVRTVIAGYHWFTDWGRDTMISLEGLTLTTGRMAEAGWILRTFAHYIRDGLIPNMFPEGKNEGLYHTADATLWFFHALDRYLHYTGDRTTLRLILPKLLEIFECHMRGTRFGIGVDPKDGLLRQGEEGYQLTWMDAKVGDWVVTPRRGKAVEINALWYNALCLLEQWVREEKGEPESRPIRDAARKAHESFNRRFWYEKGGYLYDIVDGEKGDDYSCRPNQVFAISFPHAILQERCWKPVMEVVKEKLLTPVGLRTLAPGDPEYKPKYFGNLRARDAAYHQGTVWGWLIGGFIDAWQKVYPEDRTSIRRFLEGSIPHLDDGCIGSFSEIFDAEPPYTPRGCIAQAWSVSEVLRCWMKMEE